MNPYLEPRPLIREAAPTITTHPARATAPALSTRTAILTLCIFAQALLFLWSLHDQSSAMAETQSVLQCLRRDVIDLKGQKTSSDDSLKVLQKRVKCLETALASKPVAAGRQQRQPRQQDSIGVSTTQDSTCGQTP